LANQFAPGTVVVMDRAYVDYDWWEDLSKQGVFFVTRFKSDLKYEVVEERTVPQNRNIRADQVVRLCATTKAGAGSRGLGSALAGLAPWFALVLGALSFHGFGDALMSVADQNILQRRTPDAIRSRVLSVADAAVTLTLALSFAIGGLTVGVIGPRAAYLVGGLTGVAAALLIVPLWRARRAGQPAPATEQPVDGSAGILSAEGVRA
jgi:hypothetical protein